jgi:adenylosuccinate lyase
LRPRWQAYSQHWASFQLSAGEAIAAACEPAWHDLEALGSAIEQASHPLTPVIASIEQAAGNHAQYVHFGATTQDIMDTGTVLQVRKGWS